MVSFCTATRVSVLYIGSIPSTHLAEADARLCTVGMMRLLTVTTCTQAPLRVAEEGAAGAGVGDGADFAATAAARVASGICSSVRAAAPVADRSAAVGKRRTCLNVTCTLSRGIMLLRVCQQTLTQAQCSKFRIYATEIQLLCRISAVPRHGLVFALASARAHTTGWIVVLADNSKHSRFRCQ